MPFFNEFIFHLVTQIVLQGQTIQGISRFSHFKQAGERKTVYLLLEVDVFQPKGINCIPSLIVILKEEKTIQEFILASSHFQMKRILDNM